MAQGHDIFKVFVAKKDGINLTAGKSLKELEVDEVAIYDVDTGLSVANLDDTSRFFIAINKDGKIIKSPNRWIDKDNIKSITLTKPVASTNKKVTFKDFKILCGKDYTLKVDATNELTKFQMGTNTDSAHLTATAEGCGTCGANDPCAEINPIPVVAEILANAKKLSFVKVSAIARDVISGVTGITGTINQGDKITEAQLKLINTYNLTQSSPATFVKVDILFEAVTLDKDNWEEGYLFPRETEFNVGLSEAFIGNGTFEVVETVVEQGSGFDVKHLEYTQINPDSHSRYSAFGNMKFHPVTYADVNEKYIQISIRYGHKTEVTSHLYDHFSEVVIALPNTSNTTAFETVLKSINTTKIGLS